MKIMRILTAAAFLATALLSIGPLTAGAQGPTGSNSSSIAFLDTASHSIAANSSQLYRFDYSVDNSTGTRPVTTITLVNGNHSGVSFEVWTADNVGDMTDNHPVGRGTAINIDCDTGDISASGACQSPDLVWKGAFGSGGTYYVNVVNSNNSPANFQLNITGSGVSLGQTQVASTTSPAGQAPAAAPPLAAANNDDPNKAAPIDAQQHNLAAGAATWYRFDYSVDLANNVHPIVTITLPNGAKNGLAFEVWTADAFPGGWWNNDPVGRGSAAHIDCDTGNLIGSGACISPDLTWKGAFGASGTYYVRVINNNATGGATNGQSAYQLMMITQ
ncbi:MAG: hypothetical protein ACM3JD_16590 [Rudaea sp.]